MTMRQFVQLIHVIILALLVAFIVLAVPHIIDCHMGGCETDAECERLCGGSY